MNVLGLDAHHDIDLHDFLVNWIQSPHCAYVERERREGRAGRAGMCWMLLGFPALRTPENLSCAIPY